MTPEADRRQHEIDEALADIKELRKEIAREHASVSIEELISSIHEAHKY
jgi:hypothetical protein